MSKSTGPILATGAATLINQSVFNGKPVDWRVPVATGLAAIGFAIVERAAPTVAVILAWTTFLAVMLTRIQPGVPSPTESAILWWNR